MFRPKVVPLPQTSHFRAIADTASQTLEISDKLEAMTQVPLEDGEVVLREDVVSLKVEHQVSRSLARMALTDRRVIFEGPETPWYYRPLSLLLLGGPMNYLSILDPALLWPMRKAKAIKFEEITRVWTWRPEYSLPPAIEVDHKLWSFQLLTGRLPWFKHAPKDDIREHFEAVEKAWGAWRTAHQPVEPPAGGRRQ